MVRLGKTVVVWAAIMLTAVDPASACRWRRNVCCAPACYTSCSDWVVVDSCCGTTTMSETPSTAEPTLAPAPQLQQPAPHPAEMRALPAPQPSLRPAAPQEVPPPEQPALEPAPEPKQPAAEPTEEMPEEPAKPGDEVEDLFKEADDKKTDTSKPAKAPAAAEPAAKPADDVEDLFKESDDKPTSSTPTNAAADKLTDASIQRELEDLFVEGTAKAATTPAETVKPEIVAPVQPAASEPAAPKSRLVEKAAKPQAAVTAEAPTAMRVWTDSTGKHRVNARLVSVTEKSVRLLKDTGKYTTVPFERLSTADLDFALRQAAPAIAGK